MFQILSQRIHALPDTLYVARDETKQLHVFEGDHLAAMLFPGKFETMSREKFIAGLRKELSGEARASELEWVHFYHAVERFTAAGTLSELNSVYPPASA